MKKLALAFGVAGMLLLSGCGGGGGGNAPAPVDPMTQRQTVFVFYHFPEADCMSPDFQNYMYNHMYTYMQGSGYQTVNYLFRVESNDVVCATYGKTNDFDQTGGCVTQDTAIEFPENLQYKTSCVIGMDVVATAQASDIDDQALIVEDVKALATDYILDVIH